MKRSNLNFVVDALAFMMFVFLVSTGLIMEFLLPAGSGHSTTLWGLDRHGWGEFHFWISVVFLASLAVHLYLHWKWILYVLRGRPHEGSGLRLGIGVLGLVALFVVAAAPLLSPVDRSEGSRGENAQRRDSSAETQDVLGSMTLSEVLAGTGITIDELVRQLNLPEGVSPDERLGRIARDYGFSVAAVREIVDSDRGAEHQSYFEQGSRMPVGESPNEGAQDGVPMIPIQEGQTNAADQHTHDSESHETGTAEIRGSMTLDEVAEKGVPLSYLMEGLGLPDGTPPGERIGRLGRAYGFTLTQVRELVASYR